MRICLICGEPFEAKRKGTSTCTRSSCRQAYYRLRKKMEAVKPEPSPHDTMIEKLERITPAIGRELRTIQAIYGRDAVGHAISAVNIIGNHFRQRHQPRHSPAPLPPVA